MRTPYNLEKFSTQKIVEYHNALRSRYKYVAVVLFGYCKCKYVSQQAMKAHQQRAPFTILSTYDDHHNVSAHFRLGADLKCSSFGQ